MVLFSFLFVLPNLLEYTHHSGFGAIYDEPDEVIYLSHPYYFARGDNQFAFLYEQAEASTVYTVATPQHFLSLIIGRSAIWLGLGPVFLGLVLDLLCTATGYLAFAALCTFILRSQRLGELSAVLVLAGPQLHLLPFFPGVSESFALNEHLIIPALPPFFTPILRGLFTQITLPLFALALLFTLRDLEDGLRTSRYFLAASVICAALNYLYFFGWLATFGMIGFSTVAFFFSPGSRVPGWRRRMIGRLAFLALSNICALLSAKALFGPVDTSPLLSEPLTRTFVALRPETIIVALIAIWFLSRSRPDSNGILPLIILALCANELVLLNFQFFTGVLVQPYHFSVIYLRPLLSGLILISPLYLLGRGNPRHWNPAVLLLSGAILTAVPSISSIMFRADLFSPGSVVSQSFEAYEWIRKETPKPSVVAVDIPENPGPPFAPIALAPNFMSFFADRYVLYSDASMPTDYGKGDFFKREILNNWIFGKEFETCELPPVAEYRLDLVSLPVSYSRLHRRTACDLNEELIRTYSPCQALRDYRLDYLLVYRTNDAYRTHPVRFGQLIWRSSAGDVEILKFEKERALAAACS